MINKIRLVDLASKLGAQLYGDENIIITGVASINSAKSGDITFLKDIRLLENIDSCHASAIILSKNNLFVQDVASLVVKDPYLSFIKVARMMDNTPKLSRIISSNAVISKDVILGKRIGIGSNTIIESGVILGDDVTIGAGCFIGQNTKIGTGTCLRENVTICHSIEIGEYCVIQPGAVIGSDGFGYINDHDVWMKIPHLGQVKIGNYVEIGACTTIDRGTLDNTNIANRVIIDNQCHIAHNVVIGEHTAIAGGVVMAGSLTIGRYCMIGGASVINGHIHICDKVIITGMSMVMKSITQSGTYSSGIPIQLNTVWRKTVALIMRISNMNKRVKVIEQTLKKLLFLV